MIVGGVAKRYADAIFEIGVEEGNLRELFEEFERFSQVIAENGDAADILNSAIYNTQEKRQLLQAILSVGDYSEIPVRFLTLLIEKGRMFFLGEIIAGLKALIEAHEGIERVSVTVPRPLQEEEKESITRALGASKGKKIVLEEKIDPSILGGMIITAGSTVYDGSIKTQIHRLGENLKRGE